MAFANGAGFCRITQSLDISWNSVQNLTLPQLGYVGSDLMITNNIPLNAVAFAKLVNVEGDMVFSNNSQLDSLNGVAKLSNVGGNLILDGDFQR
jgi:hypothetical protein